MSLDQGDRTYYVSDERLRAFGQLSAAQKMAWIEQCSAFIRMARVKPPVPSMQLPPLHESNLSRTPSLHSL